MLTKHNEQKHSRTHTHAHTRKYTPCPADIFKLSTCQKSQMQQDS